MAALKLILSKQNKNYWAEGSNVLGARFLAPANSKHLLLRNIQQLLVVMAVKCAKGQHLCGFKESTTFGTIKIPVHVKVLKSWGETLTGRCCKASLCG